MLKWTTTGLVIVLSLPVAALAAPDCNAPTKPAMPQNGAVISAQDLDAAADKVTAYSRASRDYQGCLDEVITTPGKYSRDEWRAALKAYNAAAPSVEEVWSSYKKLSDDWVSAHLVTAQDAEN